MMGSQKGENRVDGGLLQSETELDSEESHIHIPDVPKREFRLSDHRRDINLALVVRSVSSEITT